MKSTLTFTAKLNDEGKGYSETFNLTDFGLNAETNTPDEIELGVSHAYAIWLEGVNEGFYEIHE